jgi:hypothetical protein
MYFPPFVTLHHSDWYTFIGTNMSQELPAQIFSLEEKGQQAKGSK